MKRSFLSLLVVAWGYLEWGVSDLLLGLGYSQPEQEQPSRDGELHQQAAGVDGRYR